jgi:hypothetical protein
MVFNIKPIVVNIQKKNNYRSFFKTSVFEKATLDLVEKPARKLVFQKPFSKLTEY